MSPNDDLARWGEPPAGEDEQALAHLLADLLSGDRPAGADERTGDLLEANALLEQTIGTILSHCGLAENLPCPAGTGGPALAATPVDLRLRVLRQLGPGQFFLVASTHPSPTVLRDLQRLPDDADRVRLHTGEVVRIEVVCDREGYLTVFNVGPHGTLNLLWPADLARVEVQPARTALQVARVLLTPPAGQERLYAVWSRVPLSRERLQGLARPGVTLRDMVRVQEAVNELRPEDWHAVLLLLEHVAA